MRILVVEDESNIQKLLQVHFSREAWDATFCESGEEALKLFEGQAVQRSALVDVYAKGAANAQFPEALKQGTLKMIVSTRNERLATYSISYAEYAAHAR